MSNVQPTAGAGAAELDRSGNVSRLGALKTCAAKQIASSLMRGALLPVGQVELRGSRIKKGSDTRGISKVVRASIPAARLDDFSDVRQKAAKAALNLKKRGWAQVEGIFSRSECQLYIDEFWEWLASLGTGIRRDNPASWSPPAWPPSFRGIINSLEVAHQAFVWRVRKQPRLLQLFAELWGTHALLSSFDSINALAPGTEPPQEAWLHVDQAPWRRGICCVQGLVNLVDVHADTTGTLLVKDGSHEAHAPFFTSVSKMPRTKQEETGDHYKFSEEELDYWSQFESIPLEGKAGSLFLWDSRTVHANVLPRRVGAFRHVVYTCYQPASMASKADLEKKQKAYEEYLLTTHWPGMNIQTYERKQAVEYYGVKSPSELPAYKLHRTREQAEDRRLLQLAGVEPYTASEAKTQEALLEMPLELLESLVKMPLADSPFFDAQ